jgi:hypothetical protein
LLRPWHLTGQDEQLAVVVEMTEAARDPIWSTSAVERTPPASSYIPSSGETRKLPDGTPVTVIPYDVAFAGDWWVADVEIPGVAAASYRPFVRLTVARYQRESLPDLELSEAVRTDLVQVLPERILTVDTGGTELAVQLGGLGPDGPNQNRVDVIVERRTSPGAAVDLAALGPAEGLDVWTAVGTVSGTLGQQLQIARPAADGGAFRIRVREVELLAPAGQPPPAQTGGVGELTERVVFTDLVPLP